MSAPLVSPATLARKRAAARRAALPRNRRCPCGNPIGGANRSGTCAACRVYAKRRAIPAELASALAHVEACGALPSMLRGVGGAA